MKLNILSALAVILTIVVVSCNTVFAVECGKYDDCRYQGAPLRNPDNSIKRDWKVVSAYRKLHPCPSTGLHTGACPGWQLNHSISLACGGQDAVWNLVYMRIDVKKIVDGYERKINASIPPQPDTAACVNQIVK